MIYMGDTHTQAHTGMQRCNALKHKHSHTNTQREQKHNRGARTHAHTCKIEVQTDQNAA